MPPRERPVDRGDRRGRAIVAELGHEVRLARRQNGLTQAFLGQAVRLSGSEVGRIERGEIRSVSVSNLARLLSVVGPELSARAYPIGAPLRDNAQIGLLARFRSQLPAAFSWQTEVPVGLPGDLRAWDAVLGLGSARVGLEAETRLVDLQAVERRIALKCRDSAVAWRSFCWQTRGRTDSRLERSGKRCRDPSPSRASTLYEPSEQDVFPMETR